VSAATTRKEKKLDAYARGEFPQECGFRVRSGPSIEIAGGRKPAPAKKSAAGTQQALNRLMAQYPEVQLATLVDAAPAGDKWVHELKFDGYRLLGFLAGGETRLRTRNGNDWTESFPAIAASLKKLKADKAVFDM
jgi:bifunctional non-homologous end joining protein LigD